MHSPSDKTGGSDRAVTMSDIARICGVSKVAVSHALRGNLGEVSKDTRERVLATAKDLGYNADHNHEARRLAFKKHGRELPNRTVGIALPWAFGGAAYYGQILDGIFSVLVEEGYGMHITVLADQSRPLPMVCGRGEIDAMLCLHTREYFSSWLPILRAERGFGSRPIVGLVDSIDGCSSVHPDQTTAGYQAARHLLDLGHRRIVHALLPPAQIEMTRLEGMKRACRESGLDPEETLIYGVLPNNEGQIDTRGRELAELIRQRPEITAIAPRNDLSAVQVWKVLARLGRRIPEDISVLSCDDTNEIIGQDGENLLTTIRLPLYEQGQEGSKLVMRLINGELSGTQETTLATELIVRRSTAPPRK